MALTIVALVVFVGHVVAWVLLPSRGPEQVAEMSAEPERALAEARAA